jgi:two-component system response regulator MprA
MSERAMPPARVLIIEDDRDIREALEQVFVDEGYEVDCAEDGANGLAKLRNNGPKPAVIVLDLWMPRMDGLAFRRAQLTSEDTADIPVVVVTAGGVAPQEVAALGLSYVLLKPVDISIVLRVVRRLSSHHQTRHQQAGASG